MRCGCTSWRPSATRHNESSWTWCENGLIRACDTHAWSNCWCHCNPRSTFIGPSIWNWSALRVHSAASGGQSSIARVSGCDGVWNTFVITTEQSCLNSSRQILYQLLFECSSAKNGLKQLDQEQGSEMEEEWKHFSTIFVTSQDWPGVCVEFTQISRIWFPKQNLMPHEHMLSRAPVSGSALDTKQEPHNWGYPKRVWHSVGTACTCGTVFSHPSI